MRKKKKRLLGTMYSNKSNRAQHIPSRKSTRTRRPTQWSLTAVPPSREIKSQIGCQFKTSSNHPTGESFYGNWGSRGNVIWGRWGNETKKGGEFAWDKLCDLVYIFVIGKKV